MDIRIQDINKLLKELQGELSDALWDGDQNKAKRLEKEIDHVSTNIKKGELYEPKF
jgi:hypothetical protein